MKKAYIVILMGSKADLDHAQKIQSAVEIFGIPVNMRIGSAHKTAAHVIELLREYESDPTPKVYITIAGRSNALSGFTDGFVKSPVIACPPPSDSFGGADLFSSLRMPSGIAPAVVLAPANAALLAAKIIGLYDTEVQQKVVDFQHNNAKTVIEDDSALHE
ncbi:MAG: 5-(carboxyamino)imidazole ribonucleotide mutase [Anaerolineaceae bacterium]|nr:5-(carboxyamino)imidazole ribonucleotide mutase [Anaerolineaceae bacterium]